MRQVAPSLTKLYQTDLEKVAAYKAKEYATGDPARQIKAATNGDREAVNRSAIVREVRLPGSGKSILICKGYTNAGTISSAIHAGEQYQKSIKTNTDSPHFFDRISREWCRAEGISYKDFIRTTGGIGVLSAEDIFEMLGDLQQKRAVLKGIQTPYRLFNREQLESFRAAVSAGRYKRGQVKGGDGAAKKRMSAAAVAPSKAAHAARQARQYRQAVAAWEQATGQRWKA